MEESVVLFLDIYRSTRSFEVAILELKRKGYTQEDTIKAITEIFQIDSIFAKQAVLESLAWQE